MGKTKVPPPLIGVSMYLPINCFVYTDHYRKFLIVLEWGEHLFLFKLLGKLMMPRAV